MTGEERMPGTTIPDTTTRDTTIRQPATCEPASSAVASSRVRYEVLGMSFLMAFLMYMERGAIRRGCPVDHARISRRQDYDGLGHLGVYLVLSTPSYASNLLSEVHIRCLR
jgi:hypothetical protein